MSVTGPTRELACLALGHDDADADACPSSDDELMRRLVEEVQRLRVAAGEVEETAADRAEQQGALDAVLDACLDEWETGPQLADAMLDRLVEDGWQLTRRRP